MGGEDKADSEIVLEALRRAEQNFRTLIERAPLPMSFSRPDRLVYVNPAMLDYLGYADKEGMVGPSLVELSDEIIHPEDRARTRDAFAHLFAQLSNGPVSEGAGSVRIDDVRLRRKSDGALRFCDMHGVIVLHDGAPALVTYLHDHTARKEALARMRLADRLAALGTLAAGVAHELNNPLTFVMGNVELLAGRLAPSERDGGETARCLADVRLGLERIREIVRAMKTFSRGDEETVGPVSVIRALEASIQMAQSHLRHRGRLVRDFEEVPPVRGNEARLGQVFLNLLVNAADALDETRVERNEVAVMVRRSGDHVLVDVRDNGAGIAAEDLPHIFEPFFTTKPVGVGTGLGLFVCHGIVSGLGGEVSVRSTIGEGTSVQVRLPVATSDARAAEAPSPPSNGRARILVVDDEPGILDFVRAILETEHEVTTLSSAQDALQRLLSGESYHLVLCDLMMPRMSGAEFYARLVDALPHLGARVVFMTGGAVTASAASLFAETANRRLEKPFGAAELLDLVRREVGVD